MSYTIYVIIFILLNDIIQSNNISNLNMKSNLKLSLKGNQLINESNSYIFKKENQEKSIIGKIKKNKDEYILPEESEGVGNKCISTYCDKNKDTNVKCTENGLIPKCICSENYFGLYCGLHNNSVNAIKDEVNRRIEDFENNNNDIEDLRDKIIEIKELYYYISNFEKEINEENKIIFEQLAKKCQNLLSKAENNNIKFTLINIGFYCAVKIKENKEILDFLKTNIDLYLQMLKQNEFEPSQFSYLISDAYPVISFYIFTNNILSLQRMRKASINNNLILIDPSNCGSSLLSPTPNSPNALYVIIVYNNKIEDSLNEKNPEISELIRIEAYLYGKTTEKKKNIINQCSSLTIYMNPLQLINFTLISEYSNCSLNGIDIYNKNDPAFIDSCFMCEGVNYDLPIEYNRKNIFQRYNFSTINEEMNCSFEGIDQSIKKVKMNCNDLNLNNIFGYKITNISNAFEKIENYTTSFKCSKKVSQIHKNFAFWFYTILNCILLFFTIFFICINNYDNAIKYDNLSKGKLVSSKIIENNDLGNKDDDNDNLYESKSFGHCFSNNLLQLHPLISMFIPSIIRNQLISIWIFFLSLITIFGFNAVYFDEKMFEKRIKDSFRNNFFYPMKSEFHRIIYSILTMMAFNFLIRLIVLIPLSKFNELSNLIKEGNEESISECKNFEYKMLFKRIIAIIIILILDVFFYYFTIVFCAIYRNTQAGWFYSGIWGFIWNNLVFSIIYIIVISIVESNGNEMISYYMKRLFCF